MKKHLVFALAAGLALFAFCQGRSDKGGGPGAMGSDPTAGQSKDVGVGPVKSMKLGPIDQSLADKGQSLFENKCAMCHSLTEAKTGPPLGNVLKEVAPEFVMNMLLNTAGMEENDPRIKKLIGQYGMSMPALGLDKDQARAVLEYLRTTEKPPRP